MMAFPIPRKHQHTFTPADWYWLAEDGRVYASARDAVVTRDDQAFIDWTQGGHRPTTWPRDDDGMQTDDTLHEVLKAHGLGVGLSAAKEAALTELLARHEATTFPGRAREAIEAAESEKDLAMITSVLKAELNAIAAPYTGATSQRPSRRAPAKPET